MGTRAEVVLRASHGSTPAEGLSKRGMPCMRPSCHSQVPALTIDFLQPGHGLSPSGFSLDWTDLLRDHSAYRIGLQKPRHMSK